MTADHLGIDHLGLTVSDLDASARFFIDGLGWTRFGGNPDYPAIYVTNGHAKLTLWQQKGDDLRDFDRHANVGLHHVALKVPFPCVEAQGRDCRAGRDGGALRGRT